MQSRKITLTDKSLAKPTLEHFKENWLKNQVTPQLILWAPNISSAGLVQCALHRAQKQKVNISKSYFSFISIVISSCQILSAKHYNTNADGSRLGNKATVSTLRLIYMYTFVLRVCVRRRTHNNTYLEIQIRVNWTQLRSNNKKIAYLVWTNRLSAIGKYRVQLHRVHAKYNNWRFNVSWLCLQRTTEINNILNICPSCTYKWHT